jgi:hypothetical protein
VGDAELESGGQVGAEVYGVEDEMDVGDVGGRADAVTRVGWNLCW